MHSCPCGSGLDLARCCAPIIAGEPAATPEALMRSRYTAFTLAEEALASFNRIDIERSLPETTWLGLQVRDVSGGGDGDAVGSVTFSFRYLFKGKEFVQTELARFVRVDGRWLYNDSDINPKSPPVRVVSVGRNEPCLCGSGKKYKKCCGGTV